MLYEAEIEDCVSSTIHTKTNLTVVPYNGPTSLLRAENSNLIKCKIFPDPIYGQVGGGLDLEAFHHRRYRWASFDLGLFLVKT
jgi:hypothetical protein